MMKLANKIFHFNIQWLLTRLIGGTVPHLGMKLIIQGRQMVRDGEIVAEFNSPCSLSSLHSYFPSSLMLRITRQSPEGSSFTSLTRSRRTTIADGCQR